MTTGCCLLMQHSRCHIVHFGLCKATIVTSHIVVVVELGQRIIQVRFQCESDAIERRATSELASLVSLSLAVNCTCNSNADRVTKLPSSRRERQAVRWDKMSEKLHDDQDDVVAVLVLFSLDLGE